VINNLSGVEIDFKCIVHFDLRVWVPDGTSIVCDNVRNLIWANTLCLDANKLVFSFFGLDALEYETSSSISKETEALSCLLDCHDV